MRYQSERLNKKDEGMHRVVDTMKYAKPSGGYGLPMKSPPPSFYGCSIAFEESASLILSYCAKGSVVKEQLSYPNATTASASGTLK